MSTETAPERTAKQIRSGYDSRVFIILFAGFVAMGIWIWTGILLLSSVSASLDGGFNHGDCGTVVTFDRAEEAKDYSDRWAVACEGAVDLRAREAVGLGLASVPITALWVYLASQQHRLASELERAEILESDRAEAKRADADADADADES